MSAQSLLHSVFSCSLPASGGAASAKGFSKRKLRQTRSLDPALIGGCGSEMGTEGGLRGSTVSRPHSPQLLSRPHSPQLLSRPHSPQLLPEGLGSRSGSASSPRSQHPRATRSSTSRPLCSSLSTPSTPREKSPSGSFHFDSEVPLSRTGLKKSMAWDLPSGLAGSASGRSPASIFFSSGGGPNGIFASPRRWLQQRKLHPPPNSRSHPSVVWTSEGDFTWNSMSGHSVRLSSVPIQSLSELERARLQEVAFSRLQQDWDLGCQITIPRDGEKRKKSLRKKLDSLGKEKNRDREFIPHAFGIPLSQVIANDRAYKLKQDSQRAERKDESDSVSSMLPVGNRRQNRELSSSNSSLSSTSETPSESASPNTPEPAPRARRRGGMSVDSITDLDDNQSRLLEALQLSVPAEPPKKHEKAREKKLSLNPIYRQVPRLLDGCCRHLEKHGLQTVGIFRVGSSKKRVRHLREEFDRGVDVCLEEEHSVHDVAALLKEFLRDMPDPLLTRELYAAFVNTLLLEPEQQLGALQLLVYLLPPCNCDTLHRLLQFLSTVASHAGDNVGTDGQEVTGNKMTSLNLATIFGPNLLHKQKASDREFSVQSSARAEESAAIIAVVQKMIDNCEALFTVSPDLQNDMLLSLLDTDPDVVDYLLRRKASQSSSPDTPPSEEVSFSTGGRRPCPDSHEACSGDVSPYDNNSPVLSERSVLVVQEDGARGGSEKLYKVPEQHTLVKPYKVPEQHTLVKPYKVPEQHTLEPEQHTPSPKLNSRESSPGPRLGKDLCAEPLDIWGTWHSTLKHGPKDPGTTGSYGDIFERSSVRPRPCSLSQGHRSVHRPPHQGSPTGHDGDTEVARRTQTATTVAPCGVHLPVWRVCGSPHVPGGGGGSRRPAARSAPSLSVNSTEDTAEGDVEAQHGPHHGHHGPHDRHHGRNRRPPPPYPGSRNPAVTSAAQPSEPPMCSPQSHEDSGTTAGGGHAATGKHQATPQMLSSACARAAGAQDAQHQGEAGRLDWQRERRQIWELLSADDPDALPETLV